MKMEDSKSRDGTYTISDLADLLQVKRRTVVALIKKGKLRGFKIGNEWRVKEAAYDEFIRQQECLTKEK